MFKILSYQQSNLIWTGFSQTGNQTVVIYGNKLEVMTFSGIEPDTFILWVFVSNFSQKSEILQLRQNVQAQKAVFKLH
jgi:hypothetical protein